MNVQPQVASSTSQSVLWTLRSLVSSYITFTQNDFFIQNFGGRSTPREKSAAALTLIIDIWRGTAISNQPPERLLFRTNERRTLFSDPLQFALTLTPPYTVWQATVDQRTPECRGARPDRDLPRFQGKPKRLPTNKDEAATLRIWPI